MGRHAGQLGVGQGLGNENQGYADASKDITGMKEKRAPEFGWGLSGNQSGHSLSAFLYSFRGFCAVKDNGVALGDE